MKLKWLYFVLSGLVIIPGLVSLAMFGLKPGIDFTGGTEISIVVGSTENAQFNAEEVRSVLSDKLEIEEFTAKADGTVNIRAKEVDLATKDLALDSLRTKFPVEEKRFETVGPILGQELLIKTLTAMLLSAGGITIFVAYRFKELKYGVCAVLAMFHDTLVLFGAFSLLGQLFGVEVDVLFVTAVLTILSFSVHDTIVVYDRIRELRHKERGMAYETLVDKAVTETMGRSINNSMTIILMLLSLWLLGGETIRWFVFALLIGTVTGTYSSTFTAAPLLVVWDEIQGKRKKKIL